MRLKINIACVPLCAYPHIEPHGQESSSSQPRQHHHLPRLLRKRAAKHCPRKPRPKRARIGSLYSCGWEEPEARLMNQGRGNLVDDWWGGKKKARLGFDGNLTATEITALVDKAQNGRWTMARVITTGQLDNKQSFLPPCALRRVNCLMGIVYSPRGGTDPSQAPCFRFRPVF